MGLCPRPHILFCPDTKKDVKKVCKYYLIFLFYILLMSHVKLKQKLTFRLLYIGLLSIIFTGCSHDIEEVRDIIIKNNTDIKLVFYKEYKSLSILDTTLSMDYPWQNGISDFYLIKPYSTKKNREVKSNLKYVLSKGSYQYYLLDFESITTIPWEQIRNEYIVAKRVNFDTWEELETTNFTITYP